MRYRTGQSLASPRYCAVCAMDGPWVGTQPVTRAGGGRTRIDPMREVRICISNPRLETYKSGLARGCTYTREVTNIKT